MQVGLIALGKAAYNAILRRLHERDKARKIEKLTHVIPMDSRPDTLLSAKTLAGMSTVGEAARRAVVGHEVRSQVCQRAMGGSCDVASSRALR